MLSPGEIKRRGVKPSKRLGQNFLIDKNIKNRIIDSLSLTEDDVVLEIGPGLGAITESIIGKVKKIISVEKDIRLYDFLKENLISKKLELVHEDILKFDIEKAYRRFNKKVKVIGNLPYYISSPIIIKIINNREFCDSAYLTVQKEFAERIVSKENNKPYGSISCFVRFYSDPKILFDIKKNSFYPIPKVDSSFLQLLVKEKGLCLTDEEKLFKIIRTSFEKRRKTILNSLSFSGLFDSKSDAEDKLRLAGIMPDKRPENISLEEYIKLTEILTKRG